MASNGSSRTPFDDDLVTDPGAPKGTQPLPSQARGGAQPIRPSRLLPPSVGNAPAPYAGVTPVTPPAQVGAPTTTSAPPNDTSQLSLKRTPLSTIIGLSMAGGAVAVLLISAVVRGVTQRTLELAVPPTPVPAMAPPASNSELMPTPGAVESPSAVTSPQHSADIAPPSDAPKVDSVTVTHSPAPQPDKGQPVTSTASSDVRHDPDNQTPEKQDNAAAPVISTDTKPTPAKQDATPTPQTDGTADSSTPQPYTHRRAGYTITPPAGFKLVQRGQRTVWHGPDGAALLVETTTRPGLSPFGDWLRLDAALRLKYGRRYRSHGIDNTTIAGQPAATWDFELDTDKGTIRKIDVGVQSNGRGYAILGSAPVLKFDAARSKIESAIRSFDLTQPTAPVRRHHRATHLEASDNTATQPSNASSQNADDLRPDTGY